MIQKMLDGDQLRERRCAADVIAVVMRDHQVVDLLEAGLLSRTEDAFRVAVIGSWDCRCRPAAIALRE